jgi:hypothetical protein
MMTNLPHSRHLLGGSNVRVGVGSDLNPAEHVVLVQLLAGLSNHPSPRLWMTGKEIALALN